MDNKEMLELIKDIVNTSLSEENVNETLNEVEDTFPHELTQDVLDGMKVGMDVARMLVIKILEEVDKELIKE